MRKDAHEIMNIKGIKSAKATQLLASLELVKRLNYQNILNQSVIDRPEALIQWLQKAIGMLEQEYFIAVFLDSQNRVKSHRNIFRGTAGNVLIQSRELFKEALKNGASRIIMAHNHPSQNTGPSPEDVSVTREISEAGRLVGIPVIDHLIISWNGYYSFRENNML